MKKKWKIIFGAAILVLAGAYILTQAMRGIDVEVHEVSAGEIKRSFTEEGVVTPLTERDIYTTHSGTVEELYVEEGETVSEGQLLAVLDDSEISYKLQELEAQLQRLEGEKMGLDERPGEAQLASYQLSIQEAEETLATAERNLERVEELFVEEYELRVKDAEENLSSAEKNYDRVKRLYDRDIVSRVEYEQAQEALRKAENLLAQQEHALEVFSEVEYDQAEELVRKAQHNLLQQQKAVDILQESYEPPRGSKEIIDAQKMALLAQKDLLQYQKNQYSLKAPIGGVVSQLHIEKGDIAGPQAPVMKLFQPQEYRVETRVLTRDVFDLAVGMPVTLELEQREEDISFPGEIKTISPVAEKDYSPLGLEEERVKVTIAPQLPEALQLGPGYKLDVEFSTEELQDVLFVPKMSLFSYEGEDALFVVEEDRLTVRPVQTGLETRQNAVITEGLQEGDLVVLDPQQSGLDENVRVSYTVANEHE